VTRARVLVDTAPDPADIAELLRLAKGGTDSQLVATVGSDYQFKVLPQ
jgi:hypothetical protein